MCHKIFEYVTAWEIISLILGIILSALTTIFIIRFFRPRICIGVPTQEGLKIKIPVRNDSKRYSAVNLRIEAAAVKNDKTYHLDFDRIDFIMLLPEKKYENGETPYERTYHAIDVDNYTKDITNNCKNMADFFKLFSDPNTYLRIRVHAFHEFTGFGKAFQAKFRINKYNKFEIIESNTICK